MSLRRILYTLFLLVAFSGVQLFAQAAVTVGSQVTTEANLVSGRAYLIYYVGNSNSGYMKDTGSAYTGNNDNTANERAVYYFIDNGDGTWQVKNYYTGKYWGTPTANANTYIGSDTGGSWALNFQGNNNFAPSCNGHSWNRSGSNLHPWNSGTADVNQFKIYEAVECLPLFELFDIEVSSTETTSLTTGQWYVMKSRGRNGYLYENSSTNTLYNQAAAPSGYAPDNAQFLVRLIDGDDGKYYLQDGLGRYFGTITHLIAAPTTTTKSEQFTISTINSTDGHFYLQCSSNSYILNCGVNGENVVGYTTTIPESIGENDDWAFYPVTLVDTWTPVATEVYTLNNTYADRGAMTYDPVISTEYVWCSGKSGATEFNPTNANHQWVLYPTGTFRQYYLYNVGADKFAVPSGTASEAPWMFSYYPEAVTLIRQSDDTYKIKTADGDTYAAVSIGKAQPIINYNDIGGNFTITKVDGLDKQSAATAAVNRWSLRTDNVTVIQGNETTGKGSTMSALLRVKVIPRATCTPTAVDITLTGAAQVDRVAVYTTTLDEIQAIGANPQKIGETASPSEGPVTITTSSATALTAEQTYYLWVTADVKSTATEWETIDAAITSVDYTCSGADLSLDLSAVGNPDGVMRIYKQQTFLWTPSTDNGIYYRIPTMLKTADGTGIVALTDYRHDHPNDLGKTATGTGRHIIDVVARRSTDGGLTWNNSQTIAAGDGSNTASCGYGDPAIVRGTDGTLHCLMAAGPSSYAAGMLHVAYSKSTNNGATWSTPVDIYTGINKSGLTLTSAFTTGGKGVTFSNGRMAFAFLGDVGGTTNIYPLYSDDNGATWTIPSTHAYSGGDESKFEIMNDNSLLVSVRKGSYNGTANRAHNRTTGDASAAGIATWGSQEDWGSEMKANGCNADILYYNRSTEDATRPDVIFHTLTKAYSTYRKDLRLYMSFDQGATWNEAFQLQPGYAAYSSMQKLANGDLAIIYEDGSIGNQDKQDCYAINYVVISKEKIEAMIDELADVHNTVKIADGTNTNGPATYGDADSGAIGSVALKATWTSDSDAGTAGLTLTAENPGGSSYAAFAQETSYSSFRCLGFKPSAGNATDIITITAPTGYVIKGYYIKAGYWTEGEKYTLTATEGSGTKSCTTNTAPTSSTDVIDVTDIYKTSTTFTVTSNQAANTKCLMINEFYVTLVPGYTVTMNVVGDGKSYATLYLPFDVAMPANTTAYTVTVSGNVATLTEVSGNLPAGEKVPQGTPVVLVNTDAASSVTLARATGLAACAAENALVGTYKDITLDLGNNTSYYSLGKLGTIAGFYKRTDGTPLSITLKAYKAYLDIAASGGGVKGFTLRFADHEDGISLSPTLSPVGEEIIYDLSGRRVNRSSLKRGFYIVVPAQGGASKKIFMDR